jgi:hypothetical protein
MPLPVTPRPVVKLTDPWWQRLLDRLARRRCRAGVRPATGGGLAAHLQAIVGPDAAGSYNRLAAARDVKHLLRPAQCRHAGPLCQCKVAERQMIRLSFVPPPVSHR